ncbi:MAG: HD-GYP domain-containing protein [Bacillota bacterium]
MPLWLCDADGNIISQPDEPASLQPWLRSQAMRDRLECAARSCAQLEEPQIHELFPGCWLIPLLEKQGIRRTGLITLIGFGQEMVTTPDFQEICVSAGMQPDSVHAALQPFLRRNRSDIDQLATVLRWTYEDLARTSRDRLALEEFSDKLVQSYEETNLLFNLAGLFNSTNDPVQLVQAVCDQVHEVLPFEWLAIRFGPKSTEVPDLAGRLLSAGNVPDGPEQLLQTTSDLIAQGSPDHWPQIMEVASHAFAARVKSPVLSEPITHDGRVVGLIISGNKKGLDSDICDVEIQFFRAAANYLGVLHENLARFAEQQSLFTGLLQALTASIDAKDRYTCGHSERVGLLAANMAALLNLKKEQIEQYRIAGLLHDVGKIGIPEVVLCKSGRLNEEEYKQIKQHPEIGYRILLDVPSLTHVIEGVLHHHERWDGHGYPDGLAAGRIPLVSRVLALADAFDAMSSTRSYRPAMPRSAVLAEIRRCSGIQFDPALVPLFLSLDLSKFDQMLERHQKLSAIAA